MKNLQRLYCIWLRSGILSEVFMSRVGIIINFFPCKIAFF